MRGVGAQSGGLASKRRARGLSALVAVLFLAAVLGGCEETSAKKPDELVTDGWKLFEAGDFEHAVPAFERAVKAAGNDVTLHQQALYGLATTWNLRRPGYDRPLARKLYAEVLALDPTSDMAAWTLLALARMDHLVPPGEDPDLDVLKIVHSDYGPIRAAYQKVIDRFPEHPAGHEAFMYQQCTYVTTLDRDDAARAIAAIEAFLAAHPKTEFESALYTLIGQAHYTRGEYREHLAAAIKALQTRPIDPTNPNQDYAQPYYEVACIAEFEAGDFATARTYYKKLIDEYPVDVRGSAAHVALKRMDKVEAMARAGRPFSPFDAVRERDVQAGGAAGRRAARGGGPVMIKAFFKRIRPYFAVGVVVAVFAWAAISILVRHAAEYGSDTIVLHIGHYQLESGARTGIDAIAAAYEEEYARRWAANARNIEGRPWQEVCPGKSHIKILQDAVPESTFYGQWISTQLMGNTAPDIVEVGLGGQGLIRPVWISYLSRYFIPLTPYVNRPNPHNAGTSLEGVAVRDTYMDGMRGGYVEELQEFYCVPVAQFVVRMFYNKDLLRDLTRKMAADGKLAKEMDAPPTEYHAFIDLCRKIRDYSGPDGRHYTPIACSIFHTWMWEQHVADMVMPQVVRQVDTNHDGLLTSDEFWLGVKCGRVGFDQPQYEARLKIPPRTVRPVPERFRRPAARRCGVPLRPAEGGVHLDGHVGRPQPDGAGPRGF